MASTMILWFLFVKHVFGNPAEDVFRIIPEAKTWYDARDHCKNVEGAKLAIFDDEIQFQTVSVLLEFTKILIFSMRRFLRIQKFGLEFTTKANRTMPDEFGCLQTAAIRDILFGESTSLASSSHRAELRLFA
jgi:hypothetical protein